MRLTFCLIAIIASSLSLDLDDRLTLEDLYGQVFNETTSSTTSLEELIHQATSTLAPGLGTAFSPLQKGEENIRKKVVKSYQKLEGFVLDLSLTSSCAEKISENAFLTISVKMGRSTLTDPVYSTFDKTTSRSAWITSKHVARPKTF